MTWRLASPLLLAAWLMPSTATAQERLVGARSAGLALSVESVQFSGDGLSQPGFAGLDAARITGVQQLTLPMSLAFPVHGEWRADVTALYASGTVSYRDGDAAGSSGRAASAHLSGVSDVRVRASGPILRDGLMLTLGANVPSGRTSLDAIQFGVLRVLSAPALGLGSTSVGSGPSGTLGLVFARPAGMWTVAAGASYEYRGEYQPVAAITAGAPSADFQPGAVVRTSFTADRPIAAHRLSIAAAIDVFSTDRLRASAALARDSTGEGTAASVRLGPVVSADAQLQLATPGFRDLLVYSSFRHRSPFSRDGRRVSSSDASYLDAGARATRAITRRIDGVLSVDARWHSGLGVDQGLPTNGVTGGGLTLGAHMRRGLFAVQPYVRGQVGSLRRTGVSGVADAADVGGAARSAARQGFGGAAAGIIIVQRF